MNHQQRHEEHHKKARDEHNKEIRREEEAMGRPGLPIHPKWLFIAGLLLTILAVLVWTLFLS